MKKQNNQQERKQRRINTHSKNKEERQYLLKNMIIPLSTSNMKNNNQTSITQIHNKKNNQFIENYNKNQISIPLNIKQLQDNMKTQQKEKE